MRTLSKQPENIGQSTLLKRIDSFTRILSSSVFKVKPLESNEFTTTSVAKDSPSVVFDDSELARPTPLTESTKK